MTATALARTEKHPRGVCMADNTDKPKATEPLKPGSPEWMRRHYLELAMQSYALGGPAFREMFEKPAKPAPTARRV